MRMSNEPSTAAPLPNAFLLIALALIAPAFPGIAAAQFGAGGVIINPDGLVEVQPVRRTPAQRTPAQRTPTRRTASRETELASEARTISLRRLLRLAADREPGSELPPEVRLMAGLLRIDEVVVEAGDVLLVGPAAALRVDADGQVATAAGGDLPAFVWLEDLAVALEHVAEGRGRAGCTIDRRPEGLSRLTEYMQRHSQPTTPARAAARYPQMARALGIQDIRIFGLPPGSHAAIVTVLADVKMKRVALGAEPSGSRQVKSQLALLRPNGNSLQRWWFAPQYEPIAAATNPSQAVYSIRGPRAKVLAQEEIFASGQVGDAARTRESTEAFARLFSRHIDEVAASTPAIRALQQLNDCFLVAALLQWHERSRPADAPKLGWDILADLDAADIPRTSYPVPKTIESSSTVKRAGRFVVGLLGGVEIHPSSMATDAGIVPSTQMPAITRPQDTWYADPAAGRSGSRSGGE